MARVPQCRSPGKLVVVKATVSVDEQKALLADWDRQLAVLDAKKLDKNGNYEK